MTNKYFLPLAGAVIITLIGLGIYRYKANSNRAVIETLPVTSTSTAAATTSPKRDESLMLRDKAWNIFQSYLAAAHLHDVEALKQYAYKLSSACQNAATSSDCVSRMNTVYGYSQDFKEGQFTHIAYDDKQLILATDYTIELGGETPSARRGILYFVRERNTLKLLAFNPFDGTILVQGQGSRAATSTVQSKLADLTKDTDGDMLPDAAEECTGPFASDTCIKTDPEKRDTNGNGWWDSIEPFIAN